MLKDRIVNAAIVKFQQEVTRKLGDTRETAEIVRQFTATIKSETFAANQIDAIVTRELRKVNLDD